LWELRTLPSEASHEQTACHTPTASPPVHCDRSLHGRELHAADRLKRGLSMTAEWNTFSVRANNLHLSSPESVSVDLGNHSSRTVAWHARVLDKSTAWVAVILRDGSLDGHAELSGVAARSEVRQTPILNTEVDRLCGACARNHARITGRAAPRNNSKSQLPRTIKVTEGEL